MPFKSFDSFQRIFLTQICATKTRGTQLVIKIFSRALIKDLCADYIFPPSVGEFWRNNNSFHSPYLDVDPNSRNDAAAASKTTATATFGAREKRGIFPLLVSFPLSAPLSPTLFAPLQISKLEICPFRTGVYDRCWVKGKLS